MRAFPALLVALLLALTAIAARVSAVQSRPPPPPYYVIVHPQNPLDSVDRTFVQDAFLKKVRRWPDGEVIHPADLSAKSRTRSRFSNDLLGRSVAAVKAYWQQRIFSGRDLPPPEFQSDAEAVDYVLKYEGAVAYVSGTTELRGAKPIGVSR